MSLRAMCNDEMCGVTTNLHQFVALGARIRRRLCTASCVAMDEGTRDALLKLNVLISDMVDAVQAMLEAVDSPNPPNST